MSPGHEGTPVEVLRIHPQSQVGIVDIEKVGEDEWSIHVKRYK